MEYFEMISDEDLLQTIVYRRRELYEAISTTEISPETKAGERAIRRVKGLSDLLRKYYIELRSRGLKDYKFKDKHDYYIFAH